MAAELDALLAPLKASSTAIPTAPLHRESLEGLFRSTAALYQECLELREEVAGSGRRVQVRLRAAAGGESSLPWPLKESPVTLVKVGRTVIRI